MDSQIKWTEKAIGDLQAITKYLAEKEPSAVSIVGKELFKRIEILRNFPETGPRHPKPNGAYREIICFEYQIFYKVIHREKRVLITRVWHGKQNPKSVKI
jgi:toxin ParE1/3/4